MEIQESIIQAAKKSYEQNQVQNFVYSASNFLQNELEASQYVAYDIIIFDPLAQNNMPDVNCPVCLQSNSFKPLGFRDGIGTKVKPRLLYGLLKDSYLISREYYCKGRHRFLAHDPGILKQIEPYSSISFVLFHKEGLTKELYDFLMNHMLSGFSVAQTMNLWSLNKIRHYTNQKSLYDKNCLRHSLACPSSPKASSFPDFISIDHDKGTKLAIACFKRDYFTNEHLYTLRSEINAMS